jgi:hypothetical protein
MCQRNSLLRVGIRSQVGRLWRGLSILWRGSWLDQLHHGAKGIILLLCLDNLYPFFWVNTAWWKKRGDLVLPLWARVMNEQDSFCICVMVLLTLDRCLDSTMTFFLVWYSASSLSSRPELHEETFLLDKAPIDRRLVSHIRRPLVLGFSPRGRLRLDLHAGLLPKGFRVSQLKVKLPEQCRDQLAHFHPADVSPQAHPGAAPKREENTCLLAANAQA